MAKTEETSNKNSRVRAVTASVDWPAALFALAAVSVLCAGLLLDFEEAADQLSELKIWLSGSLKFLYLAALTAALAVCVWLAFSRTGHVRLGNEGEPPAFGMASWLGMILGAGMGVGLVIWGAAEPLHHLIANPLVADEQQQTAEAAGPALRLTMLHWGLHPWALYALTAIGFGYAGHRLRLPFRPSSLLACAVGDAAARRWSLAVDIPAAAIAILAILGGLAFVAEQIETAVAALFQFDTTAAQVRTAAELAREAAANQNITDPERIAAMVAARSPFPVQPIVAVGAVGAAAILALAFGLTRGIRTLGLLLLFIGGLLLAFLVVFGPTIYALEGLGQALGDYAAKFVSLGLWANVNDTQSEWQQWWTVFYWGWWLALALPVGLFIAVISRGRTVRQVVLGGLVAPAGAALAWIGIVGSTTLHTELFGDGGLTEIVKDDAVSAVIAMLESLRLSAVGYETPELQPYGAVLLSVLLVLAAVAFLAAGVIAVDRMTAVRASPGIFVRRSVWTVVVAGGVVLIWARGGDPVVQSLRDATFVAGGVALLMLAAASWIFISSLRREAVGEPPRPVFGNRRKRTATAEADD